MKCVGMVEISGDISATRYNNIGVFRFQVHNGLYVHYDVRVTDANYLHLGHVISKVVF